MQRISEQLLQTNKCLPVYLEPELKQRFYKGFCKSQLWPLLHYVLPMSPYSLGRFNPELWQAYVRANMMFAERLTEVVRQHSDYVWIHDYHLMVRVPTLYCVSKPDGITTAYCCAMFPGSPGIVSMISVAAWEACSGQCTAYGVTVM